MLKFLRTNSSHKDFIHLVKLLDADLAIRDGADHSFYAQFNKVDMIQHVVLAYQNEEAIGCGAYKDFDDATVEIKRMYVNPHQRGKGFATLILKELERWAAEQNYTACILETGKKQPEAIRLYEKSGYTIISNFGQYAGVENSVCMTKQL